MFSRSMARLMGVGVTGAITAGLIAAYVHEAGAYRGAASRAADTRMGTLEPGEDRPGGALTAAGVFDAATRGRFPATADAATQQAFAAGGAVFRKTWVSAPASTTSSHGLGPLYNARSCEQCHSQAGRGRGPDDAKPHEPAIALVLRLSIPPRTQTERAELASGRANVIAEPTYGGQLQPFAIQGHRGEGRIAVTYDSLPAALTGGETVHLRRPAYRIVDLGYGPLYANVMMSPRLAPQLVGLGLLEAVSGDDILSWEDTGKHRADGVRGQANRVWSAEAGGLVVGRFGWKAGAANLRQQVGEAFAIDIGISNSVVPKPSGDCTAAQADCLAAPNGESTRNGGHEIGDELLDLVTLYLRNLPVPPRRDEGHRDVLLGKALFHETGCATCHRPSFRTGNSAATPPNLRDQLIWPYTDMLLHDMGAGLADHRPEGRADGRSWRTAPLWGIGVTGSPGATPASFLHDGRARDIQEAILWHGGEGKAARDAFTVLSRRDRELLLLFVKSL